MSLMKMLQWKQKIFLHCKRCMYLMRKPLL